MQQRMRAQFEKRPPKVMVVACDYGDDWAGAGLMMALSKARPDITFCGLGGYAMEKAGLRKGVSTRISSLGKRNFIQNLKTQAQVEKADVLVTLGTSPLVLDVAYGIKKQLGIPSIYYGVGDNFIDNVKPTKRCFEHIMAVLPSEQKRYQKLDLKCSFVGHPLAEELTEYMLADNIKPLHEPRRLAILLDDKPALIKRQMMMMEYFIAELRYRVPNVEVVIPLTAKHKTRYFEPYTSLDAKYVRGSDRHMALSKCDAALSSASLSNLELAMLSVPTVLFNIKSPLDNTIEKIFGRRNKGFSINKIAEQDIIPELEYGSVSIDSLVEAVCPLLNDTLQRRNQLSALHEIRSSLISGKKMASASAADIVLSYIS